MGTEMSTQVRVRVPKWLRVPEWIPGYGYRKWVLIGFVHFQWKESICALNESSRLNWNENWTLVAKNMQVPIQVPMGTSTGTSMGTCMGMCTSTGMGTKVSTQVRVQVWVPKYQYYRYGY